MRASSHWTSNVYNVESISSKLYLFFFLLKRKLCVDISFRSVRNNMRWSSVKQRFSKTLQSSLALPSPVLVFPFVNHHHPSHQLGTTLSLGSAAVGDGVPSGHVRIAFPDAFSARKKNPFPTV